MTISVILRQDSAGRLDMTSDARGKVTWADHKLADAERSRMAFREDGCLFTSITGIFLHADEARRYCQFINQGITIDKAMSLIRSNRK